MSTNNYTVIAAGSRTEIRGTARATFIITHNKQKLMEVDFEILYDMLMQVAVDSRSTRPGFRRRKAQLLSITNVPTAS